MTCFFQTWNFKKIIPFILLGFLFVGLVFLSTQRKSILVIHSYNVDYSWVTDINEGIKRVLDKQEFVKVHYYYMDTKRHPESDFLKRAGANAQRLIKDIKPDIVIAIDDDAQKYAVQYFVDVPGISIVFGGVNANPSEYGYDTAKNVTGILERLPLAGVRDTIQLLTLDKKIDHPLRIAHIADQSATVKSDDKFFHNFKQWNGIELQPSLLVNTFPKWKQTILDAPQTLDVIILSNYRKIYRSDTDKTLVPPNEIMAWTMENATIPVIGVNGFIVEDGGSLAIATSPYEQGEVAARMAFQIINDNMPASSIPIQESRQFTVCMRPKDMEKQHIVLPTIYTAFALAINKYYE